MSRIVSIHRVASKRGPAEQLAAADVVKSHGITGDYRSGQAGRHLTLIEAEAIATVAEKLSMKVPMDASRRQVVVEGIRLNELVGRQLRLGSLLVEVHELCHPCQRMESAVGPGAKAAMEGMGGVCARVIEGGTLRVGDGIAACECPAAS
jgi:MOSC domain-containing protein YiiM